MKHNFRNLKIWKKGLEFTDLIYDFCEELPKDERYNLVSQLKRAAVSIPSNIAEGCAKRSTKEFAHYLGISLGSAYEIETQLFICKRRKYGGQKLSQMEDKIQEVQKMIYTFRENLSILLPCSIIFVL